MEHQNDDFASFEALAMGALGRLDGALEHAAPAVHRIFAARIVRNLLIAALRQEGHAFTEPRFQAWFAGLVTLSEAPARHARPPRVLCEVILNELAQATWPPLSGAATAIRPALLAPRDLDAEHAYAAAQSVMSDARTLVANAPGARSHLPFTALAWLHGEVRRSVRFAPMEPRPAQIAAARQQWSVKRPVTPSPRWAIELLYGERLRLDGTLSRALPLAGLIRLDTLDPAAPEDARATRARALWETAKDMVDAFRDAAKLARLNEQRAPGRRSTSRAPALFELLASFGALRSTQIEAALDAGRLGVRGMIAALEARAMIARETISGSHLYSLSTGLQERMASVDHESKPAFSAETLDDFDASLAHLDRLLIQEADPEADREE